MKLKVDVILATDTPATHAAQKATTTIPIVFTSVDDPVGAGVVATLARPGGNTTGLSLMAGDVVTKHVELLADPLLLQQHQQLVQLALKHRLPSISPNVAYAEAGLLVSYGQNIGDFYRRSASYVDKIVKGAKPSELPVEQPTVFQMAINLKSAKAMGIQIPRTLLLQADRLIE